MIVSWVLFVAGSAATCGCIYLWQAEEWGQRLDVMMRGAAMRGWRIRRVRDRGRGVDCQTMWCSLSCAAADGRGGERRARGRERVRPYCW